MRCLTCAYWSKSAEDSAPSDRNWAMCRRRAPAVFENQQKRLWPITHYDDWCGEYSARGVEEDT